MNARVVRCEGGHRLSGEGIGDGLVNRFLDHLVCRGFSPATVRAYAFDLANFGAFLDARVLCVQRVRSVDLFSYLDWQRKQRSGVGASTMNRRVSTVRSWCEFLVMTDELVENPVPRPRRSSGLRAVRRGMLGHVARPVRSGPAGGRLVSEPCRLPESLDPDDVGVF